MVMTMVRSKSGRNAIAVSLALGLFTSTAPAALSADPFLSDMVGNFQGKGFVRKNAASNEENIRCRLSNAVANGGSHLRVTGTCAVAGLVLPVTGSIIQEGGNKYSATIFRNLAGFTTDLFSGNRSGSNLKLKFSGINQMTKEAISATMVLAKRSASAFDISLTGTDPESKKPFSVGTIRFSSK